MASEAQLLQALQAADAAGNTDDAMALAGAIKQLRANQSTTVTPDPKSFWEDLGGKMEAAAKNAWAGANYAGGGIMGALGNEDVRDQMFDTAVKNAREAQEAASGPVQNKALGTLNSIGVGLIGLPTQILQTQGNTASRNDQIAQAAQSNQDAKRAMINSTIAHMPGDVLSAVAPQAASPLRAVGLGVTSAAANTLGDLYDQEQAKGNAPDFTQNPQGTSSKIQKFNNPDQFKVNWADELVNMAVSGGTMGLGHLVFTKAPNVPQAEANAADVTPQATETPVSPAEKALNDVKNYNVNQPENQQTIPGIEPQQLQPNAQELPNIYRPEVGGVAEPFQTQPSVQGDLFTKNLETTGGPALRENAPITADEYNQRYSPPQPADLEAAQQKALAIPEGERNQMQQALAQSVRLPETSPENISHNQSIPDSPLNFIPDDINAPWRRKQLGMINTEQTEDQIVGQQAQQVRVPAHFNDTDVHVSDTGQTYILNYDPEMNRITAYDPSNNQPVGHLDPQQTPGNLGLGQKANIGMISVDPSFQGQGIGMAMGKMFSNLFEGRIQPSDIRTEQGKAWGEKFWGKQTGAINVENTDDAIGKIGTVPRSEWIEAVGKQLGVPEHLAAALHDQYQSTAKAQVQPPIPQVVAQAHQTANSIENPKSVQDLRAWQQVVTDAKPWDQVRGQMLAAGMTPQGPRIGAFGNREYGTIRGNLVKWGLDQLNLARGNVSSFVRDLAYGQGVETKGLPHLTHDPEAPMPSFNRLSLEEKNNLAKTLAEVKRTMPDQRVDLRTMGVSDAAASAWEKVQKATDAIWDRVTQNMKDAGVKEENIPKRLANWIPEKTQGFIRVVDVPGDGTHYYQFPNKAEAFKGESAIREHLQQQGLDYENASVHAPIDARDQFVFTSDKKINDLNPMRGKPGEGYFKPYAGVSHIAFDENAGNNLGKAMDKYFDQITKYMTGQEAYKAVKPMLSDKQVQASYPNELEYVRKELATFEGKRGSDLLGDLDARMGGAFTGTMQRLGSVFNTLKIFGTPARFMYNQTVQQLIGGLPRGMLLKGQLGLEGSVFKAMGEANWKMAKAFTGKIDPYSKGAIEWLGKREMLDQSQLQAALGLKDENASLLSRYKQNLSHAVDMISRPDFAGRASLFLAFDNLLKDKIPDQQQRWLTASNHATSAMVDYSQPGKSLLMKKSSPAFAATFGRLTPYVLNDWAQVVTYMKAASGAEGFKKDLAPLGNYVGARLVAGGLAGAIGYEEVNKLIDLYNKLFTPEKPLYNLEQYAIMHGMGDGMNKYIMFGVPSGLANLHIEGGARSASLMDMPIAAPMQNTLDVMKNLYDYAHEPTRAAGAKLLKSMIPGMAGQFVDKMVAQRNKEETSKYMGGAEESPILSGQGKGTVSSSTIGPINMLTGLSSLDREIAQKKDEAFKLQEQNLKVSQEHIWNDFSDAFVRGDKQEMNKQAEKLADFAKENGIELSDKEIQQQLEKHLLERAWTEKSRTKLNEGEYYRRQKTLGDVQ